MKSYNISFKTLLFLFAFLLLLLPAYSQQPDGNKKMPTKDEIMEMSYQDLLNMPFEQLIQLANVVGVSAEDLLQMILNKEVSSASKTKEKVMQSPLSTTVITKEELTASGVTSIAEALRLVPGMIVREKTPGNYDLHIRGGDNTPPKNIMVYSEDAMSLVMIDNRPVFNYSFGGTFWETLPIDLNDVERIEVIRGPSSALYGPNAVAGVINIITKHPDTSKMIVNANLQMGTQNNRIMNGDIAGGVGKKFKYRVSGNYQYKERFQDDFYVFELNKRMSYDEMDTLHMYWGNIYQKVTHADTLFKQSITSKNLATDRFGANIFLYYDLNKNINFALSAGTQKSEIVSTTLGSHAIPYIGRTSNTQYFDVRAKAYGLEFQANYMFGDQEVEKSNPGWHISPNIFNSQLEYEYKIGTLTLRPGVSYQATMYTDKKYVNIAAKEGFLNGDKRLSGFAGFFRADYKPFEKLRLIAAVRADKYDIPDKTYLTYQFISTFNLNENNLVRVVYSRANRGPFIVDSHADLTSQNVPHVLSLLWSGNQNLKLPVMDMFEVGYRIKLFNRMMIDLEAFHNKTKDYSYFNLDSMVRSAGLTRIGYINYRNFDMNTIQNGITCNVSVVVDKKINFSVFGTIQKTEINDFYPRTLGFMLTNLQAGLTPNSVKRSIISQDSLTNTTNKSTPSVFGGMSLSYYPNHKLSISATGYFYTDQTIETTKVDITNNTPAKSYFSGGVGVPDMYKVKAKFIPNLKISYKIWNESSLYINARNFLGSKEKEFAYTDQIKGTYLIGVDLHF
jgi:iron complex outermembrane recepter protein